MSHNKVKHRDIISSSDLLRNQQHDIPVRKLHMGSTVKKFPVYIPEIKATVFISDPSQEEMIRQKHLNHFNHVRE
jgi:hypothetical protein